MSRLIAARSILGADGSAAVSHGPFSVGAFGNGVSSDGYRVNSALRQRNCHGDFAIYGSDPGLGEYFTVADDRQFQGLPARGSINLPGNVPGHARDAAGNRIPRSIAGKNRRSTLRRDHRKIGHGVELIVDGSVRRKDQKAQFFSYLDPNTFLYNLSAASPMNYVDTAMTTSSVTPRSRLPHRCSVCRTGADRHRLLQLAVQFRPPDTLRTWCPSTPMTSSKERAVSMR